MSDPKALVADLHCHNWSAFSFVTADGVNNRLQIIMNEIKRAAETVRIAGGKTLIVAGDLFHVRGSIPPSVFNPVIDMFEDMVKAGFRVIIVPGNHDLESKKSTRYSSAVTAMEKVGCLVATEPTFFKDVNTLVFPWVEDINELKKELKTWAEIHEHSENPPDLVLHAPIDGVITGLPNHGLDAEWLSKLGFKRVFAGHYHNHKDFGNGVYSIGAIAHHTWSDPESRAGFVIADETSVKYHASHAPSFVDIHADMDEMEISLAADKNYVRAKINKSKESDVEKLRSFLVKSGALGVVINAVREPARVRTTSSVKAGKSIEVSVAEYIAANEDYDDDFKAEVSKASIEILAEVV